MKIRLGLLVLLLPMCGMADTVVPVDDVESHVNIRLEPDATSDIVGRLNQGDALDLVSEVDGWYEVELEGDATGYISADWARVVTDELPVETLADEAAPEAVPEPVAESAPPEPPLETGVEETPPVVEETLPAPEPVVEHAPTATVPEPAPVVDELLLKGKRDFLVRFKNETEGERSQVYDDGNRVGIGTTDPEQRLEVNGSIRINEQNSSVAGLMITQSSGDTGYIMHNRASTLTIGAGSVDRITIDRDGNVGFGVARPDHPLQMASGAHVTAGGVWTNRSSRDAKQNIEAISADDALAAVLALEPVRFEYRGGDAETYAGFVAEDVPELVAMRDRATLSPMDVVAVLTRVVQDQQSKINDLERRLAELEAVGE